MGKISISNSINTSNTKYVGFDLDDTLHFFRRASAESAKQTLIFLGGKTGVPVSLLYKDYQDILRNMQALNFTENKPSREYRSGRFEALLEKHAVLSLSLINQALDTYDMALAENLTLKDGAYQTLQAIKKAGRIILVITEGPQDAQELTLKRLGIAKFIDVLFTSSFHEISKTEGLFKLVLQQLDCHPTQMLYVGDSLLRDYLPASALGIPSILLSDDEMDVDNDVRRILKLQELTKYF